MTPPDPRQLIRQIASQVIAENRDLWFDLKSDVANGRSPHTYGSVIGAAFQAQGKRRMAALGEGDRQALENFAEQRFTHGERESCCSRLIVAEIISRAARVVSRHGFNP